MRLFWAETRKILRPVPLLIVGVFTAIYAYLFLSIPYNWLTVLHVSSDELSVVADMIELGGPSPAPEERAEILDILEARYIGQINDAIANNPRFAEAGITDYDELTAMYVRLEDSEYAPTAAEVWVDQYNAFGALSGFAELRLEIVKMMQERSAVYPEMMEQVVPIMLERYAYSKTASARLQEFYSGNEQDNLLPVLFRKYVVQLLQYLGILCIISVLLLTALIPAHDKISGVRLLQYSSRAGRRVNPAQFCACLFSAGLVAGTQTAVTLGVFAFGPLKPVLHSGLNSFNDPVNFSFFHGALRQYLLIGGLVIVGTALAAASVAYGFSTQSRSYIGLLLILVPFAAFFGMAARINGSLFDMMGEPEHWRIFDITGIAYGEVYALVLHLALAGLFGIWTLRRLRRTEI